MSFSCLSDKASAPVIRLACGATSRELVLQAAVVLEREHWGRGDFYTVDDGELSTARREWWARLIEDARVLARAHRAARNPLPGELRISSVPLFCEAVRAAARTPDAAKVFGLVFNWEAQS